VAKILGAALYLTDRVSGAVQFRDFVRICNDAAEAKCGRLEWFGTHDSTSVTPEMYWDRWAAAKLCVLDELGTRGTVTEHQYETAKAAIDRREGKPLVVISNLPLSELAKTFDDRVVDRLAGGTVVAVAGPSQRMGGA